MFKKQTFSSWERELDFSSDASARVNPQPIFIIPVLSRCKHALHISIFFVCECMHKSKNHFHSENHLSCKQNHESAFTHFQNIISVLGESMRALAILQTGESIYITLAPFSPPRKNQQEMVALCKQTFDVWEGVGRVLL